MNERHLLISVVANDLTAHVYLARRNPSVREIETDSDYAINLILSRLEEQKISFVPIVLSTELDNPLLVQKYLKDNLIGLDKESNEIRPDALNLFIDGKRDLLLVMWAMMHSDLSYEKIMALH